MYGNCWQGERVLFHYNGHGVPRPTANGEVWVFNKSYTQYIPLSVFDLQARCSCSQRLCAQWSWSKTYIPSCQGLLPTGACEAQPYAFCCSREMQLRDAVHHSAQPDLCVSTSIPNGVLSPAGLGGRACNLRV